MIQKNLESFNKSGIENKTEKNERDEIIHDFENAFLAGFMHYKNNSQNRFPGTARLLYTSLYAPDEVPSMMSADKKNDRSEKRLSEMGNISKYACLKNVPTIEEFERGLRLCLRHGAEVDLCSGGNKVLYNKENIPSFEDALYPDVKEAMDKFWNEYDAQMVIWTAGDSSPWKGQLHKVASSLSALRKEKNFGEQKRKKLSVIAENDKMDHLQDILLLLKKRGVDKIVLIEDKLKHLKEAKEIAQSQQISCLPVWVRREGTEFENVYPEENVNQNTKATYQEEYNAVGSFADIQEKLEQNKLIGREDSLGMIIDYDGVLSDGSLTNRIWSKAIVDTLIRNNWIKTHEEK